MAKFTKMVDMASSPAELAEEKAESAGKVQAKYPYGLCIRLDEEAMAKLDLDPDDASVGDTVSFMAMAKVTAVSQNEKIGDDGEPEVCSCIELQITNLCMEAASDADASIASSEKRRGKWYGGDSDDEEAA